MGRSSGEGSGSGSGSSGLRQRLLQHAAIPSSSSLAGAAAAAEAREGPSPPQHSPKGVSTAAAASASSSSSSPRKQPPPPPSSQPQAGGVVGRLWGSTSSSSGGGGGGDRWTGLLAALWALLFLALCVNKQELWVVLAGLVGYACLCFLLDVVAIPPLWNEPLKASQTARLSNGLVCVAHSIAMGLAAGA